MKVLTVSRYFPAYHPRAGQPTEFVEKILMGLIRSRLMMKSKASEVIREVGCPETHPMYYIDGIYNYDCPLLKLHTIRAGNRWKEGEMASLRVWSGKPYHSKQIEFAEVKIKRVIPVLILAGGGSLMIQMDSQFSNNHELIAKNDGLSLNDFCGWFQGNLSGQIICWGDIKY